MREHRKKPEKKKPDVNPELKGLNITINSFGEIHSTLAIEEINAFLNTHVEDKKLKKSKEQKNEEG
jgi:hypothetical protein